ncbi:MAG: hypothetical protein IPH82_23555 [Chloroflexi bacterium]|nr:hypothetical protein [Chloroflexota bacterium]
MRGGTAVRQDYRLRQIDGHVYYYFPIGSSLFSLPFVWGANRLGVFVDSPLQEDALQNFIAACVSALIFLAVYGVFRCALGRQLSLLAALATMLGSAFSSSLGTGLWKLKFCRAVRFGRSLAAAAPTAGNRPPCIQFG